MLFTLFRLLAFGRSFPLSAVLRRRLRLLELNRIFGMGRHATVFTTRSSSSIHFYPFLSISLSLSVSIYTHNKRPTTASRLLCSFFSFSLFSPKNACPPSLPPIYSLFFLYLLRHTEQATSERASERHTRNRKEKQQNRMREVKKTKNRWILS